MKEAVSHPQPFSNTILGFWLYLMSDCILFATLFTTYAVLHNKNFGGPSSRDLFELSTAFYETLLLLFSSVASGFALLAALKQNRKQLFFWLILAFFLGLSFVIMEVTEFHSFVRQGYSWQTSAFLSSFFTLVGTHGLHVSVGLFWALIVMLQLTRQGLTINTFRRLVCWNMFWHFLDLVWIFIFTFVYLIGAK